MNAATAGSSDSVVILVEFDDSGSGLQQVGSLSPDEIVQRSAQALDNAMSAIERVASRAVASLRQATRPPTKVEISFGVKMNMDASVVISRVGAEGAFEVRLTWTGADNDPDV